MGQEVVEVGSFLVSLLLVPRDKSKGNGQVFIPWGQRRVWAQPAAAGLPSGDNLGRAGNTQLRQDARQFSPSGEQQQMNQRTAGPWPGRCFQQGGSHLRAAKGGNLNPEESRPGARVQVWCSCPSCKGSHTLFQQSPLNRDLATQEGIWIVSGRTNALS